MKKYLSIILLSVLCLNGFGQEEASFSAKKLYREFSKYQQFKEAKVPKILIAAIRLLGNNEQMNNFLKIVQKAKVISVHNPKFNKETEMLFNTVDKKLDPMKYQSVQTESMRLKIYKREKKDLVREIALLNKTGPTFHYVILKGKMDKKESEKLFRNLNTLGNKAKNVEDDLKKGIEDLLEMINPN